MVFTYFYMLEQLRHSFVWSSLIEIFDQNYLASSMLLVIASTTD